jgi:hypothetical protein
MLSVNFWPGSNDLLSSRQPGGKTWTEFDRHRLANAEFPRHRVATEIFLNIFVYG